MGYDRSAATRTRCCRAHPARGRGAALALVFGLTTTAAAFPERIASLNLCTDSLLFELVDDARIVSVTHLSRDPNLSYFHERAGKLPVNHGSAEEILSLEPDLVITGRAGAGLAERLLQRAKISVISFDEARSFAEYAVNLRRLGALVGNRADVQIILQTLDSGDRPAPAVKDRQTRALIYQPNGYTPGVHTFMHEILQRAGLHNIAAELGLEHGGFVSVERVLLSAPERLVFSRRRERAPSLAEADLQHPALRRSGAQRGALRPAYVAEHLWTCPGAFSAQAIKNLQRADP